MTEAAKSQNRVRVVLAPALVRLFPGAPTRVEVEAVTVDEMITALDHLWPGMADRLRDSFPSIRRHINIFVDGQRANLSTALPDGRDVYVLTAISGG